MCAFVLCWPAVPLLDHLVALISNQYLLSARLVSWGGRREEPPCTKPESAFKFEELPRSINTPCVMLISRTLAIFFYITCRIKEKCLKCYNTVCSRKTHTEFDRWRRNEMDKKHNTVQFCRCFSCSEPRMILNLLVGFWFSAFPN